LLALALRRLGPFLLTFVSLALSFAALIGGMAWFGIGWNSFTLPALLLSLGTGSDYFIYVVLELQEHGSPARMRARLVRPLLVCVGASVCGFGSLAWAGNLGLSSLGRVCALALALNVLAALFLMPWMWRVARRVLRK
jgi:predicted RND superfamily exporter protein